MALQGTDLLVVQHAGVVYKLEADALASFALSKLTPADLPIASGTELGAIKVGNNLSVSGDGTLDAVIPTGINFKGPISAGADAPGTPAGGDLYIFDSGGTLNATWGGLNGTNVAANDGVVYDADHSEWDYLPGMFGVGVTSVDGQAPIVVDSSNSSVPIVKIDPATDTDAGSMSAADKAKLDTISSGAGVGTVTEVKSASGALSITDPNNSPELTLRPASNSVDGIVRLAVQADVDTASTDTAVPSILFKGHEDRIAAVETFAGAGSVTEVTGVDPIEVANTTDTPIISVKAATAAQIGVVRLADATDLAAGDASAVSTAAHHKILDDRIDSLEAADEISVIGDGNAVAVGAVSAGGVTTYTVSAQTTSDSREGVVQLATTAEVETGTDAAKAVTSYGAAQTYLIKNFANLSNIP